MPTNQVKIEILLSGIAQVETGLNRVMGLFNSFAGKLSLFTGGAGMGAFVKRGIEFNATLETARLGIAAIQKQLNPDKFKTFDEAMGGAAEAIRLLQKKAEEGPATFEQLVTGFQAISGAATAAKIPIEQQIELITLMSQALSGLGIRSDQLIQESRALITGNINADAAAAKMLGITKADIDRAKEAGQLYQFLTEKLSAFAEAGRRGATTFSVAWSNLKDAIDRVASQQTQQLFEGLTKSMLRFTEVIKSSAFSDFIRNMEQLAASAAGATGIVYLISLFAKLQAAIAATFGVAAIKSVSDFSAALILLGQSPVSALGLVTAAIAGLTTALYAGVKAWELYEAREQAATSEANLAKMNQRLKSAAERKVYQLTEAGKLSQAEASAMLRQINEGASATRTETTSAGGMGMGYGVGPTSRTVADESARAEALQKVGDKLRDIEGTTARQVELSKQQNAFDEQRGQYIETLYGAHVAVTDQAVQKKLNAGLADAAQQAALDQQAQVAEGYQAWDELEAEYEQYLEDKRLADERYYASYQDALAKQAREDREAAAAKKQLQREAVAEASNMFGNLAATAQAFGRKGFIAWKAFAISKAIVDTFTAANGAGAALSSIPYVGPALAAAAMAAAITAGMANVAQIAAQSPPAYAEGGRPAVGQVALVGERGPELFVPDAAGTIIPNGPSMAALSGAANARLEFGYFDDRAKLAEWLQNDTGARKVIVDIVGRNAHLFRS